MSNHFLDKEEDELRSHSAIMDHNVKAIQDDEQKLIANNDSLLELLTHLFDNISSLAIDVKEIGKNEKDCEELDAEICFLVQQIRNKENDVHRLTLQLEELKKLELVHLNNRNKLDAYRKALNYFSNKFQYVLDSEDTEEIDKYYVTLRFIINGTTSRYPIKFIFDRNSDKLLDFDAGKLLTESEHQTLSSLYSERRNSLALMCRLRNITENRMEEDMKISTF